MARYLWRILAAVVIFFLAGEVLARALNIVDRLNGYGRLLFTRGPSADLPYVLRPGLATSQFGVQIHVNRLGLRGPEVEPTPLPGVRRVLVLGDSVVFGQGVAEDETVSADLEQQLNTEGRARWEAINAGVQGYDAVAEARFLEMRGLDLRPAVVVVGTSLNDYDPAPGYSPLGILTHRERDDRQPRLADRSEFVLLLRWLVAYAHGDLWYQTMARLEQAESMQAPGGHSADVTAALGRLAHNMHLRFYRDPNPAEMDRLRAAFADLGRITRAGGIRLLVAIFPEAYQTGADPDLVPQRRLLEMCHEVEVPCLDLQPAFAAAGGDLFLDAQHPNARGHVIAARAIAEALLRP